MRKSTRTMHRRRGAAQGQALWEYVVPAVIILISAGVLATMGGITDIIAEYFMAASGNTKSALSGGSFKTQAMGASASGTTGNGRSGLTDYGKMTYADGSASGGSAGGIMYSTPVTRTGARTLSSSSEYLYP